MNKSYLTLTIATVFSLSALLTACDKSDNTLAPVIKEVSTYERIIDFSSNQIFSDIAEASDGDLIAGGHIGADTNYNAHVVRFDQNGDTIWTLRIGSDTLRQRVLKVVPSSAGGFMILISESPAAAHGRSPFIIQEISEAGEVVGQGQIHADFDYVSVEDVIRTADNGYFIIGNDRAEFNPPAGYAMKVDVDGNRIWKKTLSSGHLNSVKLLSDGSFLLAGSYSFVPFFGSAYDVHIRRISAMGDSLFAANISVMQNSFVFDMMIGSDNRCKILGVTRDSSTTPYLFIMDVDTNGVAHSAQIMYSNNFETSHGRLTADGGAIICGSVDPASDAGFLAKVNSAGEISWINHYVYPQSAVELTKLMIVSEGGYAVTGYYQNINTANTTALVIKTDANGVSSLAQ